MNVVTPTHIHPKTKSVPLLSHRAAAHPSGQTWLLLASALALVACGGSEAPDDDTGPMGPQLPAHVQPPPDGCPFPALVPEGDAWMTGDVEADYQGNLQIHTCEDGDGTNWGGRYFRVRDVFVDNNKVTEGCYNHCVSAGACPARTWPKWDVPGYYPAVIPSQAAEQYCAWRGGRLPTGLELVRASHGDAQHIANPTLWQRTVDCFEVSTPECVTLNDHTRGLQLPVGSVPDDLGPFGHHDLFGNRSEMTSSYNDINSGGYCDLPADAYEPVVAPNEDRRLFYYGGQDALWAFPNTVYSLNYTVYHNPGDSEFRCAFDPVY